MTSESSISFELRKGQCLQSKSRLSCRLQNTSVNTSYVIHGWQTTTGDLICYSASKFWNLCRISCSCFSRSGFESCRKKFTRAAITMISRTAPSPSMTFRLSLKPKTFSPMIRSSAEPVPEEPELPEASEFRSGRIVSVIRSAPMRNRVAHCAQRPLRPACSCLSRNSLRH